MCVCVHARARMCVCTCVKVCVCVCACVCARVCACICICICTCMCDIKMSMVTIQCVSQPVFLCDPCYNIQFLLMYIHRKYIQLTLVYDADISVTVMYRRMYC